MFGASLSAIRLGSRPKPIRVATSLPEAIRPWVVGVSESARVAFGYLRAKPEEHRRQDLRGERHRRGDSEHTLGLFIIFADLELAFVDLVENCEAALVEPRAQLGDRQGFRRADNELSGQQLLQSRDVLRYRGWNDVETSARGR